MKARNKLAGAMIIMVVTILAMYGIGCAMIFRSVEKYTREAQETYSGAPIPALIALVGDESAPFEMRNGAIWALGQIGDERALPVLHGLYTGEVQNLPYDSTAYIVQYSVQKAIKQINGFTVTKWMYCWL